MGLKASLNQTSSCLPHLGYERIRNIGHGILTTEDQAAINTTGPQHPMARLALGVMIVVVVVVGRVVLMGWGRKAWGSCRRVDVMGMGVGRVGWGECSGGALSGRCGVMRSRLR